MRSACSEEARCRQAGATSRMWGKPRKSSCFLPKAQLQQLHSAMQPMLSQVEGMAAAVISEVRYES